VINRELTWTWKREEVTPGSYGLFAGLGKFGGPGSPIALLLSSQSGHPDSSLSE